MSPRENAPVSLSVVAVHGLASVQDGGRPGLLHQGVPVGGALVPALLARANAAAGNGGGAAGLELFGAAALVFDAPVRVASDDGAPRWLAAGEVWSVSCEGARVRYLAVRGGIDVPVVLGGRGTHLGAGFGGHLGRPLRRGDPLRVGAAPLDARPPPPPPDLDAAIVVASGPDLPLLPPGAFERLLASRFTVDPRSDRVGLRLAGGDPSLGRPPGDLGVSAPMVRGAVQLPPDGVPVVLGPDHPTMGGYPVVAVVASADLGAIFARPVGSPVRFVTRTSPLQGPGVTREE